MRLELSNRTDLAARALAFLSGTEGDQPVSGGRLASRLGTTTHYLPQVMRPLIQHGWVSSSPGPHGGYTANEIAPTVSMLELIEAVEGPLDNGRCVLAEGPCGSHDTCALHTAWSRARAALMDELLATPVGHGADQPPAGHQQPTRRETTQ